MIVLNLAGSYIVHMFTGEFMKYHFKKSFIRVALLCLCTCLCLPLLASCRDYDSTVLSFYKDTCGAKYNAIKLDFGKNNSGIYYIDEQYGVWQLNEERYLFDFDYIPQKQGGGALMIYVATQQSYYDSMVSRNDGTASFYNGKMVFSGRCEFSDGNTVATISPDNLYDNEMSIGLEYTVTLTKTNVPDDDMISFDVALEHMKYVPDAYFRFLSDQTDFVFSCDIADLWVNGSTMLGEWNTNGSVIPVRMKLHGKVPYVEIYDVSGSSEKLILKSYVNVIDDSTIELLSPEGEVFYTAPSVPVIITKKQSVT